MQVAFLILIAFLVGCAKPNITQELEEASRQATAILEGTSSRAAWEVAGEIDQLRLRAKKKRERRTVAEELWWTWKYAMWGQGSSKDWPWSW